MDGNKLSKAIELDKKITFYKKEIASLESTIKQIKGTKVGKVSLIIKLNIFHGHNNYTEESHSSQATLPSIIKALEATLYVSKNMLSKYEKEFKNL